MLFSKLRGNDSSWQDHRQHLPHNPGNTARAGGRQTIFVAFAHYFCFHLFPTVVGAGVQTSILLLLNRRGHRGGGVRVWKGFLRRWARTYGGHARCKQLGLGTKRIEKYWRKAVCVSEKRNRKHSAREQGLLQTWSMADGRLWWGALLEDNFSDTAQDRLKDLGSGSNTSSHSDIS